MNVYDFDKTVFYPDSSACFVLYCLRRWPGKVLPAALGSLGPFLRYRRGSSAKPLKERIFSFLARLDDPDAAVRAFWARYEGRLQSWYLAQRRADDLILSASPEFLLRPLCDKLGVALLATPMDRHSGRIPGENCHDEEKVRRFRAAYPDGRVERFYSDSLSDAPMAALAEQAYLVKKGHLLPWPKP